MAKYLGQDIQQEDSNIIRQFRLAHTKLKGISSFLSSSGIGKVKFRDNKEVSDMM